MPVTPPPPPTETPTVAEVVAALESAYDPALAESWDAVGLAVGDPETPVRRVLFAVDPVAAVVDEAIARGADLLVTHHPLFLRGVHGVAATTPKGAVAHRLIRSGIGLFTAHTNADAAIGGVSDALADLLGVRDTEPLEPGPGLGVDKLVVFVPEADAERVLDALAAAGAGRIGDYSRCAWSSRGVGTFRPEVGATPAVGVVGVVERVPESRLEVVLPRSVRQAVLAALFSTHPYDEPAFDLIALPSEPSGAGLGRVGTLTRPVSGREFAAAVARALPATPAGVRVGGDLDRVVRRVAVCGGAGDSFLGRAAAVGADAYVTADLRHHPASEALEAGGPLLIDGGHWATEWPWLRVAARSLTESLADTGATVETFVSARPTDPWALSLLPAPPLPTPSR